MRKILLATTALVAFAGAAQAAESPIQVTLGGYVDFRAAMFHEAEKTATDRRDGDFQTEYGVNVDAVGKAAGGIEYGARVEFTNSVGPGGETHETADDLRIDSAYIYMSGPWGKVLMGDEQGASDLFVFAPTVGEGQIDGKYVNFTDPDTLTAFQPAYVNLTEDNTKVTYYTPKVGNENHKIQLGMSYAPNPEDGSQVTKYDVTSAYRNRIEASAQYTGSFEGVSVVLSPMMEVAEGQGDKNTLNVRDYTLWGVGGQASYAGFTLGASYVDAGKRGTTTTQDEDQDMFTVGLSYGFDKTAVAVNYMNGEGYDGASYRDSFSAIGMGATYTWFPGLTTAAEAVFFDQSTQAVAFDNEGAVFMLSQKMAF